MATTTINITGTVSGLQTGSHQISIQVSTAAGFPSSVDLASGNNTITRLSGATGGVIVRPPAGNTQALILKGVAGDTGIAGIAKTGPQLLCWESASAPANFVINAANTVAGVELIWF